MKDLEERAKEFSKYDPENPRGAEIGCYRQGLFNGFVRGFIEGHKAAQDGETLSYENNIDIKK